MSRIIAPLLSFDARGQIAKSQVYSSWKGTPYARRYVIPANPDTAEQQLTRSTFRTLNGIMKYAPALVTAAWNAGAEGRPLTGRNLMVKANLANLREQANMDLLVLSPGAKGGPPLSSFEATPGDGSLSLAAVAPALPVGWTLASVVGAAIVNGDPQTITDYIVTADSEADTMTPVVLTGLTNDAEYQVCMWATYTRPDGLIAYGPSISVQATPTD